MAEFVKITGLAELKARLIALPKEISGKSGGPVLKALRKMGRVIQKSAIAKVRRKTGTLAENIIVVRSKDPKKFGASENVEVTVRYKAAKKKDNRKNRRSKTVGDDYKNYGPLFYARFLEFGTSKMPGGYPFMRPAFDEAKSQLPEIFRADLTAAIDAAVLKLYRQK